MQSIFGDIRRVVFPGVSLLSGVFWLGGVGIGAESTAECSSWDTLTLRNLGIFSLGVGHAV